MATRKRVAGKFVPETAVVAAVDDADGAGKTAAGRRIAAPRPKYCRTFARARFAEALPEIAETLLKQAKDGSVPHMKLLIELSGLNKGDVVPRATKKRGKSLQAILEEEWQKEKDEIAAEG